jgi:hypothetical protein
MNQFAVLMLLFLSVVSGVSAKQNPEKFYIRIAHNVSSSNDDLSVTSLGGLSLKNNMIGHADLTYLKSDVEGEALVLDLGAGLAFDWHVSPYLSIGASLGYNWDQEEYLAAYFPEAGVIVNFTKAFGVTLSARRYYSLYQEDEDVVMLGLVFRK